MKTLVSNALRVVLWLLVACTGGIICLLLMVRNPFVVYFDPWPSFRTSAWQVFAVTLVNSLVAPVLIYRTVRWWNRRHDRKPSLFLRLTLHVLTLAVSVPWLLIAAGSFTCGPQWPVVMPQLENWLMLEPTALFFLACLALGAVLRVQRWDPYCIVRLVAVGAVLTWLRWDCAPPAREYTWADLPQPPRHEADSRVAQLPLLNHATHPIQAGQCQVQNVWPIGSNLADILTHSNEIEQAWLASSNWFALQTTLTSFYGIADVATNSLGPRLAFLEQRRSAQFLAMYAMLKARQGNYEEAVRVLAVQNTIVRKSMPYSATLVGKMIWISLVGLNVSAACYIADDTNTPRSVLRTMKDAFPPFSPSTIAFGGWVTGELVMATAYVDCICTNPQLLVRLGSDDELDLSPASYATRLVAPFLIHRNRTLREYNAWYAPIFAAVTNVPMECINMEPALSKHQNSLPTRNFLGWWLIEISMPNCMEATRKANVRKTLSDLLAVRIRQRLGEPIEIMDYFTGKPYPIDATGKPYSVGPDRIAGTEDDIKFANPPDDCHDSPSRHGATETGTIHLARLVSCGPCAADRAAGDLVALLCTARQASGCQSQAAGAVRE